MASRMLSAGLVWYSLYVMTGCVSAQPPPDDLLSRVPVIEIGQPEPQDKPFVLLIRAGKTIPLTLAVKSPLFLQSAQATAVVHFTRSLYIYKDWSSFDGLNWTQRAFTGSASFGLAPKGGVIDIQVNRSE